MPRGERIANRLSGNPLGRFFSSRRVLRRGIGQKEERMAPCRLLAIVGSLAAAITAGCKDSASPPAAITVTAVSPASDLLGGGSSMTITGTTFIDVTSVTIGGGELRSRTVVSTTEITGITPAAANPGTADVVVTSSSHGRGTCLSCFSYRSLGLQTQALAAGATHTCGLTSAGQAYCWGDNTYGQLGNGSTAASATPVPVSGILSFLALNTANAHTCALTSSGAAYCWGYNVDGRLGDGSATDRWTPVPVSGGLSFSALAAGAWHTCGLTSAGAAYCWGAVYGTAPVTVSGGLSFSALAAVGGEYTCGLKIGRAHV